MCLLQVDFIYLFCEETKKYLLICEDPKLYQDEE